MHIITVNETILAPTNLHSYTCRVYHVVSCCYLSYYNTIVRLKKRKKKKAHTICRYCSQPMHVTHASIGRRRRSHFNRAASHDNRLIFLKVAKIPWTLFKTRQISMGSPKNGASCLPPPWVDTQLQTRVGATINELSGVVYRKLPDIIPGYLTDNWG